MAVELVPVAPRPPGVREVASRLDADALAAVVADRILAACFPGHRSDAGFADTLHRCTGDNVHTLCALLAGRLDLDAVVPAEALAFAELAASLDIPAASLERAYQVGAAEFWNGWFAACEGAAAAEGAQLDVLLREPTMLVFAYVDRVLAHVRAAYEQARAAMVRTREQLRRTALAAIIGGAAPDADQAERALAYPVRWTHVAVRLRTPERREVERHAPALRAAAGAQAELAHQDGGEAWTLWLGRPGGFGRHDATALAEALAATGLAASVSEPWPGLDGLRRTHEEAALAATVQAAAGDPVVAYVDVRLDALLLTDPARARRFVADELGALGGHDPRLRLVRDALLQSLSTGSHVAAAARLGVHENTVRNRVRHAEELLPPGAVLQRRTELQVALRLERLLRSGVDVPGDRRRRHQAERPQDAEQLAVPERLAP
jgi:hypothetical protein